MIQHFNSSLSQLISYSNFSLVVFSKILTNDYHKTAYYCKQSVFNKCCALQLLCFLLFSTRNQNMRNYIDPEFFSKLFFWSKIRGCLRILDRTYCEWSRCHFPHFILNAHRLPSIENQSTLLGHYYLILCSMSSA